MSGARISVLLGGARAGKTSFAERLAGVGGEPVTYLATSPRIDGDLDLEARIARHRADRPASWSTVEEEIDLAGAIRAIDRGVIVIDCLTTWVGNLMHHGHGAADVLARAGDAVEASLARDGATIVVTNEVGLGIVPPSELGRAYRDALGRVNQRWVSASERALLIVAGRALPLHEPDELT